MGGLQCLEPSTVHANTQAGPAGRAAWAVPESRFHRQRHPQNVGAVEGCVLSLCRSQASRHPGAISKRKRTSKEKNMIRKLFSEDFGLCRKGHVHSWSKRMSRRQFAW